ncbi:hypothetical protein DICPUDRAFT_151565 [Dictyostelium purpureum]|uniref:RNB domain-containing protein n=1 Tax=Dictyostelium purpureum TaxID=5786 RepID=F0ZJ59_DICPU|nr:uncharacterized protein DICPUDRAFT_151565 [Dictyostelium purpureum]EGC36020.1 hypothetical protein DICPUDRAFT_151565 [Dictyostelium purpureum]|eukprot:XP_003287458.1 hypothetical protein DICPUDRAFT_151565 [Dictyostelium purpureum]
MLNINPVKNGFIKRLCNKNILSIRYYCSNTNSFLDSLDWDTETSNKPTDQRDNITTPNNIKINKKKINNSFSNIQWPTKDSLEQQSQPEKEDDRIDLHNIRLNGSDKGKSNYNFISTDTYKEFSSSSIQIIENNPMSKRKKRKIKNNINNSLSVNTDNNNIDINSKDKIDYNNSNIEVNVDSKIDNINNTNIDQNIFKSPKFFTPMLDQVIKCNERFKFILNPAKLEIYDVVLVYNRVHKRIYLDYISMIDVKNNKMILSENNEYSINEIILCFPLSPLRRNNHRFFNEFIESLSDFADISQQHVIINELKHRIEHIKHSVNREHLFGSFDSLFRELLVFLNDCFISECNSQFDAHSLFFEKYGFMSEKKDGIINGLKIIGDISDWADQYDVQVRSEIPISEGASLFYRNTYYKSKWGDILLYFYFVSSLEYFPFYQLSSPRNFCFRSTNDEIFSNIEMLNNIDQDNIERTKFFKYCISEIIINNPKDFKLNKYSDEIYQNEAIQYNIDEPFQLYISLLKKYYTETQCIERYNNYETKLIFSKLLEPIGITKSKEIKLFLSFLLAKFKNHQESPKNEITFINNPKIQIEKNIEDKINNRIEINEKSILLEQMDSSITLGEINPEDESISLNINIPDFTDLIPETSSIDTWCMLKSLNFEKDSGEVCKMIPEDIYDEIKIKQEDENKPCISIFITFSKAGEIINYSVSPSILKNVQLLTDSSINNIIKNEMVDDVDSITQQENELIKKLISFSKVMNCKTKYSLSKLSANNIKDVVKELSNHVIARYASENNIEIPYWNYVKDVQISNSTSKNIKIITSEKPSEIESLKKGSKYKNQNIYLTPNSNIISPLTNYIDLFVLRIIKNHLVSKQEQQEQQQSNNQNETSSSSSSPSPSFSKEYVRNIIIPYLNFKYLDNKI